MIGIYTGPNGEQNFETDMVSMLIQVGWDKNIIKYPTHKDLENNLRKIINENNIDMLGIITPLTDNEFAQILSEIHLRCVTPTGANVLINDQKIRIQTEIDRQNYPKNSNLDLMIFNRADIASGKSRYQIAEQPVFNTDPKYNDRRGDIMLLINGLPLIHIELKAAGHSLEEGTTQIQKYMNEGVFTGIFSMIQIFFVMTPDDCIYFANSFPLLNPAFFFHWGDKSNNPVHDWKELIQGENQILSIPEAHQLVGYYTCAQIEKDGKGTVSNGTTGILMVARSYQIHAIRNIAKRVAIQRWETGYQLGGYVWGTTGCGKTLTSYKAGQLIIDENYADKVIFVVDRVQLSEQSFKEYKNFARDGEPIIESKSTYKLFDLLRDNSSRWIITSIQKLARINEDASSYIDKTDIDKINKKRIVFIIDEAHRSQFGEMHKRVKDTFTNALFIGFTGTPIFSENDKENGQTSADVFGDVLSTYSIASGIRDKNVLGFAPKMIKTFNDNDIRDAVACDKAHADSVYEARQDPEKYKVYRHFHDLDMITLEDMLPSGQYDCDAHRKSVVQDILTSWPVTSRGCTHADIKFHAILATNSIKEAIEYYKLLKDTNLNVTALFNTNVNDNTESVIDRENAIIEIVDDYNKKFGEAFDRKSDPQFKKFASNVTMRLSHKESFKNITDDQMLDIVIVVDMLLTGFDSKYVNTLYMDKVLETDNLIQAISRTNRVFNENDKPFGLFRYYRKPYTMEKNIREALRLYCEGGDTSGAIVDNIDTNLDNANRVFSEIKQIFENNNISDFLYLPAMDSDCQKFRKLFVELKQLINSMRLQGMNLSSDTDEYVQKLLACKKWIDGKTRIFKILEMRYNDLKKARNDVTSMSTGKLGYDIDASLSEIEQSKIDADYLEEHFRKIIPTLIGNFEEIEKDMAIADFSKQLAILSMEQQKYANIIINDIREGLLTVTNESLHELIAEYKTNAETQAVIDFADKYGLDAGILHSIYHNPTDNSMKITELLNTCNRNKAQTAFGCSGWFSARGKLNTAIKNFIQS